MLKVLFQNRRDAFENWGGDTTQMVQTRDHLISIDVNVDISLEPEPILKSYDLVHIFNIQNPAYGIRQLRNAIKYGVPVAVSPIYWDMRHLKQSEDLIKYYPSGVVRSLANIHYGLAYNLLRLYRLLNVKLHMHNEQINKETREMLRKANLLLPNSVAEAEHIAILYNAPWIRGKSLIVPNGINAPDDNIKSENVGTENSSLFLRLPKEYVLEVGRVEPVKGQLKVINALLEYPEIPLVFVGKSTNKHYLKQCLRLGNTRGNTWFIDEVSHDELSSFYKCAHVHVLPSLRESPGLVTLEAAVHGANCVVSFHGPIIEYFGGNVWCCDPENIESIKNAVLQAWNSPHSLLLKEKVIKYFTWKEAARITLEGYKKITKKNVRNSY